MYYEESLGAFIIYELDAKSKNDIDTFMRKQAKEVLQKEDLMKSQHLPKIEEIKSDNHNLRNSELVLSASYLDRRYNKNNDNFWNNKQKLMLLLL